MWLPAALKEDMREVLIERANEAGLNGEEFVDKIADESKAASEEEVLEFISSAGHPALEMDPMV